MKNPLPVTIPQKVINALQRAGYQIDHQTGSHVILRCRERKKLVIVPNHNRDMKKGTLKSILCQSGLTIDEFLSFLLHFLKI